MDKLKAKRVWCVRRRRTGRLCFAAGGRTAGGERCPAAAVRLIETLRAVISLDNAGSSARTPVCLPDSCS
jgi:hypothetical protein